MDSLLEPVIETDMQHFCVEIMKRLDSQRRREHFCDVILEVGFGDDQALLKAHRIVLCAASPFFYNALNSEMREKKEGVIRLKDASKALMEEVLEYMYTGHVDITEQNAYELMAVADYFIMRSLKLLSSKFIEQTLSISNCIMVYYSSVKYQCAELQERARSFILANFMAVTESEDFLSLNTKQVEEWIASDEIIVKGEEEVFMTILRWIEKGRRKKFFFELFRHVRCVYVSRNYLVTVILKHPVVKGKKECLDLVLDAMKEVSDGTKACFLNHSPRNCLKTHEDVIFACGGEGGNKAFCYLPSQNKLYKMRDAYLRRNSFGFGMSACQGKLYVVGGRTQEVECYYPSLNSWTRVKPLKQGIKYVASVTFQGFLNIIGGVDTNNHRLSAVQKYNPDLNLWQEVPPLRGPRSSVCAVADGSNIYAIGGLDARRKCLNIVEKFDPVVNSWKRIASTQAKRRQAGGVSLQSKIFVFGGLQHSGGAPCEMYDKETNVWTGIENAVAPRYPASAVCFKGQIFVFSGFGPNQSEGQEMEIKIYRVDENDWKPCQTVSLGSKLFRLSTGRILKEVLDSCDVL